MRSKLISAMQDCDDFLAIILINGGSTFCRSNNALDAVTRCKKLCESDWGSTCLFDADELGKANAYVHVYDARGVDAWHKSYGEAVKDTATGAELPWLFTVSCQLQNTREQRARAKAYRDNRANRAMKV